MYALLSKLLSETEGPRLTIVLPLIPGPSHGKENAVRLGRLIDEAQAGLDVYDLSAKGKAQFLAAARDYSAEELNLVQEESSLCMFVSPGVFEVQTLPGNREASVLVGDHFYLTPLFPYIYGPLHFGILALSKGKSQFFEVVGDTVIEAPVPDMPPNIEAVSSEVHEKSVSSHSSGDGHSMYHGQKSAKDQKEPESQLYCQRVASALLEHLKHHYMPVVFCGVTELWGIYKKHHTSGYLCSEYVKGNPDHVSPIDLAKKAQAIVQKASSSRNDALKDSYGVLAGESRVTTDLGDILRYAQAGKVEVLLLCEGSEQWGIFSSQTGEVALHERTDAGVVELYGLAASLTLRHRGHIAVLPRDQMPEECDSAAGLRL